MSLDGNSYQIIYHFKSAGNDGSTPFAALTEASDGFLYGTTRGGGTNLVGTIFKISKDGSTYQRLYSFRNTGGDGQDPYYGSVVEGPGGDFYGTTFSGGSAGFGAAYRLTRDGVTYGLLRSFGTSANDARHPWSLMAGSDGYLYGIASDGAGTNLYGAAFRISTLSVNYSVLHSFGAPAGADGSAPQAGLVEAFDGMLYGATIQGGASAGTLFRLNKDGTGYNILHNFSILPGDGKNPQAALLTASDSVFYGTTSAGGISNRGTAFSIQQDGKGYQILHSFTGSSGDGSTPHGALIEASDGMIYGSTVFSGTASLGTLFQISKDGTSYNVLHSFSAGEGQSPECALIEASDGMLYGTARIGGAGLNFGTVFTLAKDGNAFAVLHSFTNGLGDGSAPYASLLEASDGKLFGTTSSGGAGTNGTIFKLQKNGEGYEIVHHFAANRLEGVSPRAALLSDSNGILYGTTFAGGISNKGAIFRLNQDGTGFTVLHHFGSYASDASSPLGSLVEGNDGVLYGTSQLGGSNGSGTVFRLNKDGANYAVVRSFIITVTQGINLYNAVIKTDDGALCGTTYSGGSFSGGIIFRLLPPQVPVITNFSCGPAVARIIFTGTSGYNYIVLRSTNLNTWSPIVTNVMPPTNALTYQDPNLPTDKGFYRAAWMP